VSRFLLYRLLHYLLTLPGDLVRVFRRERLSRMAAALAYSTLLTLAPLTTLVLVIATRLPGFDVLVGQLDLFIIRALLPNQTGGAVAQHIHSMARQADNLTWPWALTLVSMVFLMLHTLEGAFNQIWGVREGRSWRKRLPMYLVGMVGVPFFMGMLTSLSYFLVNLALGWGQGLAPYQQQMVNWLDFALLTAFFALLYAAMPNVRVNRLAALWGGMIVSLAMAGMKLGFRWYIAQATFYSKLYGALAILPIFLLWLYLTWVLVLVVAILVANLDGVLSKQKRGA
jgi:membrane protein